MRHAAAEAAERGVERCAISRRFGVLMSKKTLVLPCNGADCERLDSLVKTDWNAVRILALNCLDAAQGLKSWADDSQRGYNDACTALHLAAIKKAEDVFSQSLTAFSSAGDTVFEQIAQASVGEGSRPDFGFTATAHESTLVLLGLTVRWVNIGLGDALVSIGARDAYNGAIQDLHLCSPKQLRDALHHSEKSKPLQPLFDRFQPLIRIRAWIDREWAAILNRDSEGVELPFGYVPNVLPKVIEWAKDIGEYRRLECKDQLSKVEKAFMRTVKQRFNDNPEQQAAAEKHWECHLSKQSDSSAQ